MSSERPHIDPLLVDPTRLSIVAILSACEWAEFGVVRDAAAITDSALSKQVTTLEKSRYLEVNKGYVGRRPRTWLQLTGAGRDALERHIAGLALIVRQGRAAGAGQGTAPPADPPD